MATRATTAPSIVESIEAGFESFIGPSGCYSSRQQDGLGVLINFPYGDPVHPQECTNMDHDPQRPLVA
jgi:hypothetical protein